MIYFISDFHLDSNSIKNKQSSEREKKLVSFLDDIKNSATEIFLLGDVFDFWFEFKNVVPKGFVRFLGKLAELSDKGIIIHYFVGNHDMWMRDYFDKELNIKLYYQPQKFTFNGKVFYLGHGDGLGPKTICYKLLKFLLFKNQILYHMYINLIHPDLSMYLGALWSSFRKKKETQLHKKYLGDDKESLTLFCLEKLKNEKIDFFIFGHRHIPFNVKFNNGSQYFNTGDWITHFSYVVYDYNNVELKYF